MECPDPHRQFTRRALDDDALLADPITQFQIWHAEAQQAGLLDPDAVTLATVANDQPTARVVYMRGCDERGFVFFTNYTSRKGQEVEANPQAALNFFWAELERQVRIEGTVSRISSDESDVYFNGRPRGSQLGAWVSPQSEAIASRDVLDERLAELEKRFAGLEVPRPPYWGGYRLTPQRMEFWQGRPNRLHDRICYHREEMGWRRERLAP